jgi:elongation factor 4
MKTVQESRIGDTFFIESKEVNPLPGFKPAKPMVYAGIYPEDVNDYIDLEKSIYKLALTDPSVAIFRESSAALGSGFRCGFLGILHMDVFKQRLDDEYGISTIVTSPSVQYRCKLKDGKEIEIENALMAPEAELVNYYEEPIASVRIITPKESLSNIIKLCEDRRGTNSSIGNLDENKVVIKYEIPLAEIITDFFDKVKSLSRGYATLDYDFKCFRKSKIKKLTVLIMGEALDALSFMVHEESAFDFGKRICQKLKEKVDRQLFTVAIQAKLGSKIIAREDIPCMRKNVTAKCYGGDYSRKKKLLERQKEGKKNMRKIGNVEIKKDLFIDILKN